jgi:arylsulfatase
VARRPNILLLMADQHRADILGCAGDPVVSTPNLDRLAAEGVRFERAYCLGPLCMPARASVLTERYVRDHGVFENASEVDVGSPTFLTALREAGYHTGCVGKMHLWVHGGRRARHTRERVDQLRAYGFAEPIETVGKLANVVVRSEYSEYLEELGLYETYREFVGARTYRSGTPVWNSDPIPLPADAYVDEWHGRRTVEWIESWHDDCPFFQWVGFPGPHDPWDAPRAARKVYEGVEMPMPGTLALPEVPPAGPFNRFLRVFMGHGGTDGLTDSVIQDVRRAYYADVTVIDRAVGSIMAALERTGRLDDTWVIYTSDHGEMMGEHRMLMKMVFYEPSVRVPLIVRPPGGTEPRVVNDLVEQFDLSATLRELAGAPALPDSEARSLLPAIEDGASTGRKVVRSENYGFAMFRDERYKLVVYEDDQLPGQLFDLEQDPREDHNLIADPGAAQVLERMMQEQVRPFLETPARRPHPDLIARLARGG